MLGRSRSIPLFRIAGINVGANWTWLLTLFYLIVVLSGQFKTTLGPGHTDQAFAFAVGVSLLFFASIVAHEFGHAIVARRNGIGILGIELWLLGGLASFDRDPDSAGVEFRVAAAGPLVTAIVALAAIGGAYAVDPHQASQAMSFGTVAGDDPWLAGLAWLGVVNAFLLAFNLIPAFPLDGGRIARAIAWRLTGDKQKATVFAGNAGRVFGWALAAYGLVLLVGSRGGFSGIFFIFMGMMLAQTARDAVAAGGKYSEVLDLTVADVMDRDPVVVRSDFTINRVLDEFFWRYRWPWFPVIDPAGRFMGLIEQQRAEAVPEPDRTRCHAAELVDERSGETSSVSDRTPVTALLMNPQLQGAGALMAVDDRGLLSGVVTLDRARRAFRDAVEHAESGGRSDPPPTV